MDTHGELNQIAQVGRGGSQHRGGDDRVAIVVPRGVRASDYFTLSVRARVKATLLLRRAHSRMRLAGRAALRQGRFAPQPEGWSLRRPGNH